MFSLSPFGKRLLVSPLFLTSLAAQSKVDFVKDIQPIFQKSCQMCHGPNNQMGNLRLDAKRAVTAKVVVPGDSAGSPLYQRVAGLGETVRMPMGGALAPAQIATIKAWIDQGADWPDEIGAKVTATKTHWAFIPPERPAAPVTKNKKWPKNPIDAFILARLEKENLSPSPEADRVTLLRRLSLDLIGLPPTTGEVDAFLKDQKAGAYERQVDRLLHSAHYGERWGRQWLDAAQYADSNGFEKDQPREVWFYRDWVINALNHNLPYDRFIIDQIAGDMLPNATQDDVVATGFLRNSLLNEEGGVDPEQFRMEAMFDRMHVIGTAILGLTVQCAQCHNHKFDPLKQSEYYGMLAFLNQTHEAGASVYTPEEELQRAGVLRRISELEEALQRSQPDWRSRMSQWEEQSKLNQPEWSVLKPEVDYASAGGEHYMPMKDGSLLALGSNSGHRVKLTVKTEARNITAFRLELLADADLPHGGPGRSKRGNCALSEFEVEAAPADHPEQKTKVKFARATADFNSPERPMEPKKSEPVAKQAKPPEPAKPGDKPPKKLIIGPVGLAIDGKEETAWSLDAGPGQRNQSRKAVFTASAPIDNPGGTILTFYLAQQHWVDNDDGSSNNIGRLRLALTSAPDASADPVPAAVREILAIPAASRTPRQVQTVFRYWRTTVPEWTQANAEIAAQWAGYPEGVSQLVFQVRQEPRETHILTRGEFLKPGKVVGPGVPAYLNPLPAGAPVDRLTFAKWMVDRKAPTTARSLMNRFWQAYFGAGIVATSENLGTQAESPAHPELLDWLAVEFMDRGWDMKAMHRLIVTSAAYRQSSQVTPKSYQRDPYNRLISHGPRLRVDGEIVRDIALEASGLLNPKIGGPSVFPPAPAFLFVPPVSYSPKPWPLSAGADRYRRALYTFRYRSVSYPMLESFDTPNGESSCVRRARSNTPLQALTTLNDPNFVEMARALALKTLNEGGATENERLVYAFRRCVSRRPTEVELTALNNLLDKEKQRYADGKHDPWALLAEDAAHRPLLPKETSEAQAAAWTVVSRAILNLDETITKE